MFKKFAVLSLLIFQSLAAGEVSTSANLESVKVFLGGAEITHSASIKLSPGVHEVVIDNVANNFNTQSLQAGGTGDFVILSVTHRKNYIKVKEKTPKILALEDSLKLLKNNLAELTNDREVLEIELSLLMANKEIGGENTGVSVTQLKQMMEYFRVKSAELKKSMYQVDKKIEITKEKITKIENQINELNNKTKVPPTEIVLTVSAEKNTTAELDISYVTFDAGWNPSYDLRADDINSPLKLNLRANVGQNTGLDWKDVDITLSTRSARQSNNKPELRKWFIDFFREMRTANDMQMKAAAPQMEMMTAGAAEEAESMADYMMVNETQLAVEYKPEINYTIPSDGKPHIVSLQNYELPAEYEYYAAPKLDTDAFLVAYAAEWNKYNLLPGSANIYFDNSFVGTSYINPATTEKRMAFSLGRDENIYITRETLKDFTEDKFFGGDIERFFGYEISVKNNKNKEVTITIEDQAPIPQHEDIDVEVQELSGATYNKNTGIVSWTMTLNPGETVSKKFAFSVRYPEDKPINLY